MPSFDSWSYAALCSLLASCLLWTWIDYSHFLLLGVRYICCICSYQEISWAAVLSDLRYCCFSSLCCSFNHVALSSLLKCLHSVYSVLLLPPNWETSWNIHLLGSVGNGLANTIQLMQSHFNNALIIHLSIFKRSCDYLWQEICL